MNNHLDLIKRQVCEEFGISLNTLTGPHRKRQYVRPRQVVMYIARQMTPCSTTQIGRALGGRDHTTVLHGVSVVQTLMAQDHSFKKQVDDITSLISATIEDDLSAQIDLCNLTSGLRRAALRLVKKSPGRIAIGMHAELISDLREEFGEVVLHTCANAFGSTLKMTVSDSGTWSMLEIFGFHGDRARLIDFGDGWRRPDEPGCGGMKRISTPPAKTEAKHRECLKCRQVFFSRSYRERVCKDCRKSDTWRNPGDARLQDARV